MPVLLILACLAMAVWALVLVLPWQPHRTRERLEAAAQPVALDDVTVLIPARNEAATIGRVLTALARQGPGLEVFIVDDESTDATGRICREHAASLARVPEVARPDNWPLKVQVVAGASLPSGWAGKLWALQQGLARLERRYVLLLDADIELAPYTVGALRERAQEHPAGLVSVMATLRTESPWERLLVPAFIFFFKLLYPFALVNAGRWAGAAGGCMLVEAGALRSIGGYSGMRDALIDDCTLAARLRRQGGRLWLGMSHSVQSLRPYPHLADFWSMVVRTAFTQLRFSWWLLAATMAVMLIVFVVPLMALAGAGSVVAVAVGFAALVLMGAAYWPVVRFYRLSALRVATLPVAAILFLAMTVGSAINHARGTRATWKDRTYDSSMD